MASSGTVTANVSSVLASQYNNLRDDVLNISTGHIHDGSADGGRALTSSSYGALTVLQAAVQHGVPWLLTRQGGNVNNWSSSGTVNYSTTTTGMDGQIAMTAGEAGGIIADGTYGKEEIITYPITFAYSPLLFAVVNTTLTPWSVNKTLPTVSINPVTGSVTTQAQIRVGRPSEGDATGNLTVYVDWFAIGLQA